MTSFENSLAYEEAMGKWSRAAGRSFLEWINAAAGLRWLDVGCGTGAFTDLIVKQAAPDAVAGIDPVATQIDFAVSRSGHGDVDYRVGDALNLPFADGTFDICAMALVIAFLQDRKKAIAEMARTTRPGGTVATYIWDLPGGGFTQQPLLDALGINQEKMPGYRDCSEDRLKRLFEEAGLDDVSGRTIDVEMTFDSFDAFWASQTGFPSTPVRMISQMPGTEVNRLKATLRQTLPTDADGRIAYSARANAVKGVKAE